MKAFNDFSNKEPSFWAFIKFISENLGYTKRRQGIVKSYSADEVNRLCKDHNIPTNPDIISDAVLYCKMRADLLNSSVQTALMDAETAEKEFNKLFEFYQAEHLTCLMPMNKQKGSKRKIAFFTSIINILTELTIRSVVNSVSSKGFDDDPHNLAYIRSTDGSIIGASSRRFDGIYPNISNPKIVWEIKEYYYTNSFGSRIADGIYETQLDGFEFKELYNRTGKKVYHILFVDAYSTWWLQGKSYLCRIIDLLNAGFVDEVIIGREVLTRWPELLSSIISQ